MVVGPFVEVAGLIFSRIHVTNDGTNACGPNMYFWFAVAIGGLILYEFLFGAEMRAVMFSFL